MCFLKLALRHVQQTVRAIIVERHNNERKYFCIQGNFEWFGRLPLALTGEKARFCSRSPGILTSELVTPPKKPKRRSQNNAKPLRCFGERCSVHGVSARFFRWQS